MMANHNSTVELNYRDRKKRNRRLELKGLSFKRDKSFDSGLGVVHI